MKRERIICADSSFFQGEEYNLYDSSKLYASEFLSHIASKHISKRGQWLESFFFRREANLMISRGVQLALNLNRFFEILKQLTTIITSLPQTVSSLYKLYTSLQTI